MRALERLRDEGDMAEAEFQALLRDRVRCRHTGIGVNG